MSASTLNTDIAIIGGGAVGCALALGLQTHTNLSVTLIDAGKAPHITDIQLAFDQRTIALSAESVDIMSWLGSNLDSLHYSPIEHIHVSDKGHAGQVLLHASDYDLLAFGRVVSLANLGAHLYSKLPSNDSLKVLNETQVVAVERSQNHCQLQLDIGGVITSKLVVLADGGRSPLVDALGLSHTTHEYDQTAITLNIKTSEAHQGWAYERFTESGPLALLPLAQNEFGVVWTVPSSQAEQWIHASPEDVKKALQTQFGYRCGIIQSVSEWHHYPLALRKLASPIAHRVLVVGNAAQTLHPIAGQGVNLGFRDVRAAIQTISKQLADCGEFGCLDQYRQARNEDRNTTISLTDTLVSVFSNQYLPMVIGRNIGLTGLNLNADLKRNFANTAMGKRDAAL